MCEKQPSEVRTAYPAKKCGSKLFVSIAQISAIRSQLTRSSAGPQTKSSWKVSTEGADEFDVTLPIELGDTYLTKVFKVQRKQQSCGRTHHVKIWRAWTLNGVQQTINIPTHV